MSLHGLREGEPYLVLLSQLILDLTGVVLQVAHLLGGEGSHRRQAGVHASWDIMGEGFHDEVVFCILSTLDHQVKVQELQEDLLE